MRTSDQPPVTGGLFLYQLSLAWKEGVGVGSGQSYCGTNPVWGASWLLKADLLGNDDGLALLLALRAGTSLNYLQHQ